MTVLHRLLPLLVVAAAAGCLSPHQFTWSSSDSDASATDADSRGADSGTDIVATEVPGSDPVLADADARFPADAAHETKDASADVADASTDPGDAPSDAKDAAADAPKELPDLPDLLDLTADPTDAADATDAADLTDVAAPPDVLPDGGDVLPETVDLAGQDACIADCTGKECGDDGCGGTCGSGCDDLNPCTDDSCDGAFCKYEPNALDCSDGNACTYDDVCKDGGCGGKLLALGALLAAGCFCADDESCKPFDDNDACTGQVRCLPVQQQMICMVDDATLPVPGCTDDNPCTDDSCDPATGCAHAANTSPCDDLDACTAGDACSGGECVPGASLVCDDGNPCTDDWCDHVKGCTHVNNMLPCDDYDPCTSVDACVDGQCVGGGLVQCDDGDKCTEEFCEPGIGCVFMPFSTNDCDVNPCCECLPGPEGKMNDAACNDNNACTLDKCVCIGSFPPDLNSCWKAACFWEPIKCVPDSKCSTASCDPAAGKCVQKPVSCDDGNVCTIDACAPLSGCQHTSVEDGTGPCESDALAICLDGVCCHPSCQAKECGPDGCGGDCGGCQGLLEICVAGVCVCQPDCQGKQCGDNGCNGSCGTCPAGQVCSTSACVPACQLASVGELGGQATGADTSGDYVYLAVQGSGLYTYQVAPPEKPLLVSREHTPKQIEDVAVNGAALLAASGQQGLHVYTLTTPGAPAWLASMDTQSPAYAVDGSGGLAVLAEGTVVEIVDVSSPAAPKVLSKLAGLQYARELHVVGSTAYVADGFFGLKIVDFSDPAKPVAVGQIPIQGGAGAVYVAGSYAYVGVRESSKDLVIVNVANPASPSLSGSLDLGAGEIQAVTVVGSTAYLAGYGYGLGVAGVGNPQAPTYLGGYVGAYNASDVVSLPGSKVAVVEMFAGLNLVDVSSPSVPKEVASTRLPSRPRALALTQGAAVLVEGQMGFQVIDTQSPEAPTLVSYISGDDPPNWWPEDVAVAGTLAVTVSPTKGLVVVDIAAASAPKVKGQLSLAGTPQAVAVQGATAFVAAGTGGLHAVQVSSPSAPSKLGTWNGASDVRDVDRISDHVLVAAGADGLVSLDVTVPSSMKLAGTCEFGKPAVGLRVEGGLAYVFLEPAGLAVVDLSAPGKPQLLFEGLWNAWPISDLAVLDGWGYAAAEGSGLQLLDLSQPFFPVPLGEIPVEGSPVAVSLAAPYLYVASSEAGLKVLEIGGCLPACDSCGEAEVCSQGQCRCQFAPCLGQCCAAGQVCHEDLCCQPSCDGKKCGDDGCGGSCGQCTGAQEACVGGQCVCQPACTGKACGPDGCGGVCGQCGAGQVCINDKCPAPGKQCDDGNTNLWDGCSNNAVSEFNVGPDLSHQPAVACLASGRFVVAYKSKQGGAAGDYNIRADFFEPGGGWSKAVVPVNTVTQGDEGTPAAVGLPGGNALISWVSGSEQPPGLLARTYSAGGTGEAGPFNIVAGYMSGAAQCRPWPAGGFLAAWSKYNATSDVSAALFTEAGLPSGPQMPLTSAADAHEIGPTVGVLAGGSFAVAWSKADKSSGWPLGAYMQRFSSAGAPEGPVVTLDGSKGSSPSIAVLSDGRFVAAWTADVGGQKDIQAQLFKSDATTSGGKMTLNVYTSGDQSSPLVAALPGGGFVAVWTSYGQDGFGAGVFGQRFDSGGGKVGGEFQVNTFKDYNQEEPALCAFSDGSFVVAWTSWHQENVLHAVFAQRFNADGTKAYR